MRLLPRDWYFRAGRARLYRRVGAVIINAVLAGGIIGALLTGEMTGAGHLLLPAGDDYASAAVRPLVHFRDCNAARAAGAAPLRRGDAGYEPRLDADADGIACEPLP